MTTSWSFVRSRPAHRGTCARTLERTSSLRIEQIEALDPKTVVAGHKRPDARDDGVAAIFSGTKGYVRDFERALSEDHSAQELVDKMMILHGALATPTRYGRQHGRPSRRSRAHHRARHRDA